MRKETRGKKGAGGGGGTLSNFQSFCVTGISGPSVSLSLFTTVCLLLLRFLRLPPPSVGSFAPHLSVSFHGGLGVEPAC